MRHNNYFLWSLDEVFPFATLQDAITVCDHLTEQGKRCFVTGKDKKQVYVSLVQPEPEAA